MLSEIDKLQNRVKQRKDNESRSVSYQLYLAIIERATDWGMTIDELKKTVKYLDKAVDENEIAMRQSTAISKVDVL